MSAVELLPVVRFTLAGWPFAVEAAQVAGMLAIPEKGIHAASLLGLPRAEHVSLRWLAIRCADATTIALAMEEPIKLEPIPVEAIQPLPHLLAARHQLPGLLALALEDNELTLLLDLQAVCKQTTENNIEMEIQP